MLFRSKDIGEFYIFPPTSVRTLTNTSVKELIKNHSGVTVEFWKLCLKKKHLLGHIIQVDPQDPTRQVLFPPDSLIPRTEHARRVGHWLIETYADAYRESGHVDQFDINNILQKKLVNELAQHRLNIIS